jgi:hypothetical protein
MHVKHLGFLKRGLKDGKRYSQNRVVMPILKAYCQYNSLETSKTLLRKERI